MKYIIHYSNNDIYDSIIIEATTIEELRELATECLKVRNWEKNYCWSEKLNEPNNL